MISKLCPSRNGIVFADKQLVTLQEFSFEIDANGAAGTIGARFQNTPSCAMATANFTAPPAPTKTVCTPGQDLGGMVFKDFNLDGARQAGETAGTEDITVTAIDVNGVSYATTTDPFGLYKLNVPLVSYPVRLNSVVSRRIPTSRPRPATAPTTAHRCNSSPHPVVG